MPPNVVDGEPFTSNEAASPVDKAVPGHEVVPIESWMKYAAPFLSGLESLTCAAKFVMRIELSPKATSFPKPLEGALGELKSDVSANTLVSAQESLAESKLNKKARPTAVPKELSDWKAPTNTRSPSIAID
jgi:hypothetical protein